MDRVHLYIVLTRTNTMISRLIHLFTHDEYTHAALALDSELQEMYSFGRKYTYNPFLGRFKQERLNEGTYGLAKKLPGVILDIEVSPEDYMHVRELIEHFRSNQERYRYNVRGLFYGLLKKPTTRDDRFLCSQFVYFVLHESRIVEFDIPASLVRPVDFLTLDARIAFMGDLKRLLGEPTEICPMRTRFFRWVRNRFESGRAA